MSGADLGQDGAMGKWITAGICVALLASCGGDEETTTGGTDEAKVVDVAAMDGAKGEVTFCTGKDTSGDKTAAVKSFNEEHPDINVELLEFSASADEQRAQFVQRQEAESGECDVFYSDVIWTAEFASQQWIYDLTPYVETRKQELIPATLGSVDYEGKLWGMPHQTNAAFLYYRTDQVSEPPKTWQEVYEQGAAENGVVYQGAPYEGLTCDFLEVAFAAGGQVLSEDGKSAVIDSPENEKALQLMVDGVEDGVAANGVTTYMEEEARRYFESGRATFMRNWPYAYELGQAKGSKVRGKFDVAPLPSFEGGGRAAILGGHNFVISVYSENAGAALKWIDYATNREQQLATLRDYSQAAVLADVYDDPAVRKKFPFAPQLRDAVSQAKSRPVSPVYPQISQAIYENVSEALNGRMTPKEALAQAQAQIEDALATF
ncbi:MAG TPA: ABC transporter substrate-binding protein [Solirubrobacteraceae bacterium]|nr:ABC transporter substrate-binding protein [Solirubrobacteraceae bacterium]